MSKKLYRLKKDLPDCPAGREIYYDDNAKEHYSVTRGGSKIYFQDRTVEDNPDWFEEVISEPKKERIDVQYVESCKNGVALLTGTYLAARSTLIRTALPIPEVKMPAVRAAIEAVLNDDKCLFDAEKINHQLDKIEAMRDAFNAARKVKPSAFFNVINPEFETFNEYLVSLTKK